MAELGDSLEGRRVVGGRGSSERRRHSALGQGGETEERGRERSREWGEETEGSKRSRWADEHGEEAGGGRGRLQHAWHAAVPTGRSLKKLGGAGGLGRLLLWARQVSGTGERRIVSFIYFSVLYFLQFVLI